MEEIGLKKVSNLQKYIDKQISLKKDIKITVVPTGRMVKLVRSL